MEIIVKGKQIDLGDSFRAHAEETLSQLVEKYFDRAIDAAVIISKDAHLVKADISVHPISGLTLQATAGATDPYPAFDGACEKIAKQLRRYKRRLTDHSKPKAEDNILAQQFIIKPEPVDAELPAEEAGPVIVAEMSQDIPLCTVSGAVMRLDLSDTNAILFRNSSHGRLNMVYRRQDGNIGWVDPEATDSKG
ncbi:MAG: ribosome-associated translation inhibitor RaiA [Rhodospirillaceae bacterium]|nr:ribosome-associated translation inhibitor RaiA [Rhodospirillaceae bacterium]